MLTRGQTGVTGVTGGRGDGEVLSPELVAYLGRLTPKEYKAYQIAKSHLGMSFDLAKSNGYRGYQATVAGGGGTKPSSG